MCIGLHLIECKAVTDPAYYFGGDRLSRSSYLNSPIVFHYVPAISISSPLPSPFHRTFVGMTDRWTHSHRK